MNLTHHGVLGMKWGVRRDRAHLDRISGRTKTMSKSAVAQIRRERAKKTLNTEQKKMLDKIQVKRGEKAANRVLSIYGAKRYDKGAFLSSVMQQKAESVVNGVLYMGGAIAVSTLIARKIVK